MKSFKEFGIKTNTQTFSGDKIKMSKILNREIAVLDYKVEASKFKGECLYLQIQLNDTKHIVFTSSRNLRDAIEQVPKAGFPFKTTIIEENERFEFT